MVSFLTLAFVNLDISGGGGRNPPPAQLTPQKSGMNRVKRSSISRTFWTTEMVLKIRGETYTRNQKL